MARHKSRPAPVAIPPSSSKVPPATLAWRDLKWDELTAWAGAGAVARGKDYQATGRVKDLAVAEDGAVLATVLGGLRYATTVRLRREGQRSQFDSECTCPVGFACKHAVAAALHYGHLLDEERVIPAADPDDPRWARIEAVGDEFDEYDEALDDGNHDLAEARPAPRRQRTASWDGKIERHIRGLGKKALADLAWDLVRRLPEAYDELRDRITLQGGGVDRLIAEARAEVDTATAEPGWRRGWDDDGHSPDFRRVAARFERLLELGQADAVVQLGRDYIEQAQEILEISDDEGETIEEFGASLPVVFAALAKSSLAWPDRLLFVVDAELADQYDAIGSAADAVLESCTDPAAWSSLADTLAGRLKPGGPRAGPEADFSATYRRDQITDWIARALIEADRVADLEALYEAEARAIGSYRRLVDYLVEADRLDDAERWAMEGIAESAATAPGVAEHLAEALAGIAGRRRRWDLVAAHAARPFFERPTPANFDALVAAARKAKVEPAVRAAALRFLETGAGPWRWLDPAPPPGAARPPTPRRTARGRAAPAAGPAPARRLGVDPAWPLPVPPYFLHLMGRLGQGDAEPHPHLHVLLEMALLAGDADEVLRRYDQLGAAPRPPGWHLGAAHYADRVAAAVAARHPARALEIYRSRLDALLPRAEQSAYAAATEYLRALRPVYAALDRAAEWDELLASIRLKYKNRPRFMELLAGLDGQGIAKGPRPGRR